MTERNHIYEYYAFTNEAIPATCLNIYNTCIRYDDKISQMEKKEYCIISHLDHEN